jgi:hypothetical protein
MIMVNLETSASNPWLAARVGSAAESASSALIGKHFLVAFRRDAMLVSHVALLVKSRILGVVSTVPCVTGRAPVVLTMCLCAWLTRLFASLDVSLVTGMCT